MTYQYIKKYSDYIDKPISNKDYNDIIYYLQKKWYLQLLKDYGITLYLICLQYYIENENYMRCKAMDDTIVLSNRELRTNYKKTLKDYGILS